MRLQLSKILFKSSGYKSNYLLLRLPLLGGFGFIPPEVVDPAGGDENGNDTPC